MKDKLQRLLEKIKTNKKLQIMLLGLVVCVILLVYLAYFVIGAKEEEVFDNANIETNSTTEYVAYLENKLENVISNIEGVGKVNVAITISSGFVYEYAYEDEGKTNLLLANKEPIILAKTLPQIQGVLVVAEGGESIKVKLDILSTIQTLTNVTNENITILSGEF